MKRIALLAALLLHGCEKPLPTVPSTSAGAALERAAIDRGLVADPVTETPIGLFTGDTDKVCVTGVGNGYRIGASVDYGEDQACTARGTARGRDPLRVTLGADCTFAARFADGRITFPPVLPVACDRACTGRASLAALTATRLSDSQVEARSARDAGGRILCPT